MDNFQLMRHFATGWKPEDLASPEAAGVFEELERNTGFERLGEVNQLIERLRQRSNAA